MEVDVEQLSDSQLREQLAVKGNINAVITDQTREYFRRKLQKLYGHSTPNNLQTTTVPQDTEVVLVVTCTPDDKDGFYVLSHTSELPDEYRVIYNSRSEAVKAAKSIGARFRRFDTKSEAESFVQDENWRQQELSTNLTDIEKANLVEKKYNPFSSVKTKEKNRLRKLMEEREIAEFVELIWKNPKHLVSSGDNPEIYHEGMRRNILHCAVDKGNLEFCTVLFQIIQNDEFWKILYPHDSIEKRNTDKLKMVDKYLNMQDGTVRLPSSTTIKSVADDDVMKVKSLETPLHIASKKGNEEIVKFLMSFPDTDTYIKNYDGKTAAEVACTRVSSPSVALKERIVNLINAPSIWYVPVVHSPDFSTLGNVCVLSEPLTSSGPIGCEDNAGSQIIGQAFAGPLSPVEAQKFHKQWKHPHSAEWARNIRRSDSDRGLERIGRVLAHNQGVKWSEYWHFLSCYCDLSKPDGLQKLELYLSERSTDMKCDSNVSDQMLSMDSCTSSLVHKQQGKCLTGRRRLFTNGNDDHADESIDIDSNEPIAVCVDEDPLPNNCVNRDPLSCVSEDLMQLSLEEGSGGEVSEFHVDKITGSSSCNVNVQSGVDPPVTPPTIKITSKAHSLTPKSLSMPPTDGVIHINPSTVSSEVTAVSDDFPQTPGIVTDEAQFRTPTRSNGSVYIVGYKPTKLDRDVYLALCDTPVDPKVYPCIARWKALVESHGEDERKHWPTPKSTQPTHRIDSIRTPLSPLLLSSSPSSPHLSNRFIARPISSGSDLSTRSPWQQTTPTRPSKLQAYNTEKTID